MSERDRRNLEEEKVEIKRILFLGFSFTKEVMDGIKNGLKDKDTFFVEEFPSNVLYDYDIIILNLDRYSSSFYSISKIVGKKQEIETFLRGGKILACHLVEPKELSLPSLGTVNNYDWSDITNYYIRGKLHNGLGEVVVANRESKFNEIFSDIFNNFKLKWRVDMPQMFSAYMTETIDVLAINNVNIAIAFFAEFKKSHGGGRIIFLPSLDEPSNEKIKGFYVSLVNSLLKLSKSKAPAQVSPTSIPAWINDYPCYKENELDEQISTLERIKQGHFEARRLLYEKDSFLIEPINFVFKKLGYETEIKEKLGREDIMLKREGFRGIVEVTSFESEKVKVDKTFAGDLGGQLTAHLRLGYTEEEREQIKLMAVINYETGKSPSERREWKTIFTDLGLEVLESFGISVLSSRELFQIYNSLVKNDTEEFKTKVREKIETTNGLLDLRELGL